MELTDLKVGSIIDKKELGYIGEMMEDNPKVICISFTIYDYKSGVQTELKLKTKDYEQIQKELEEC